MHNKKILVVEDEQDLRELIQYNLSKEGYKPLCAGSGEEGLEIARSEKPDLIVLDIMLPGTDGFEVCKELKRDSKTSAIPIIMLTAKGEDADIVAGLELGADDYVTKPFSPRVLVARIRNVLRKSHPARLESDEVVQLHEISIDPTRHEVQVDGDGVDLTSTEFRLLHLLVRNAGRVFTRFQIVERIHGDDYPVTDRSVDVQIVALRKKLGSYGRYIETVRGVGYRFQE